MNPKICASCQWLSGNIMKIDHYVYADGDTETCQLAWDEQMDHYVPVLERNEENDGYIHDKITDKKFKVPLACPYRLEHLIQNEDASQNM